MTTTRGFIDYDLLSQAAIEAIKSRNQQRAELICNGINTVLGGADRAAAQAQVFQPEQGSIATFVKFTDHLHEQSYIITIREDNYPAEMGMCSSVRKEQEITRVPGFENDYYTYSEILDVVSTLILGEEAENDLEAIQVAIRDFLAIHEPECGSGNPEMSIPGLT